MATFKILGTVLILLCAFAAISNAEPHEKCTQVETMTPVHNFQYLQMMGNWYGYKRFVRNSEDVRPANYTCYEVEYRYDPVMLTIFMYEKYMNGNGEGPIDEISFALGGSPENHAYWEIFSQDADQEWMKIMDALYVHTDYENWALQYACSGDSDPAQESMLVWTRSRNPDQHLIDLLLVLVENFGFSLENEIPHDWESCPEM